MKLLIVGSKGQVGRELVDRGIHYKFQVTGVDIEELDICDASAVSDAVVDMQMVVNAAAYTAVDAAEAAPDAAFSINRDGPRNLATACAQRGIPLIHISTDYVYDGRKDDEYREDDPVSPVGVYARSKAEGDNAVAICLKEHLIIRTAWVYGIHGNNFVKTMLQLGRERELITVVNDQFGCPTYAADLAEAILRMAQHIQANKDAAWGVYHYCGKGRTSWYGFAERIFHFAKAYEDFQVKRLQPVTTREFPTPARRPANSVLNCKKIGKTFSIKTIPWEKSLAAMLRRLYTEGL